MTGHSVRELLQERGGDLDLRAGIPEEWLRREIERTLTDEQRREIEALGGGTS